MNILNYIKESLFFSKDVLWDLNDYKKKTEYQGSLIIFKNIKIIKSVVYRKEIEKIKLNKLIEDLDIKYKEYKSNIWKLDNLNNRINWNISTKEDLGYILNNDYLNLISKNEGKIGFFKLNEKKNRILFNHLVDLNVRKLSSRLEIPYYFFPRSYNEKGMPTQLKHWTSSVYNYNKIDNIGNNFLDIYVSKLLESFFNIKYLDSKNTWNIDVLKKGFKSKRPNYMIKFASTMMRNTSDLLNHQIKNFLKLPSVYLRSWWLKEQYFYLFFFKFFRKINTTETGFFAKNKYSLSSFNKVLISKPLFKHTPHNLTIDLFIFNNKSYDRGKLKNIISIRSIYKYMYSLYVNNKKKIKNTINRPRIFYVNLIEPRIISYYEMIVSLYEKLLMKKNEIFLFSLYFLVLYLNNLKFNHKNRISSKIYNKLVYNLDKVQVISSKKKVIEEKRVRKISESHSRYLVLKEYLKNQNRKSITPLDLNSLTLWNEDDLEKDNKDDEKQESNRVRKFTLKKYSYEEYRRRNLYGKKWGRKQSSKKLKEKLMGFFLLTRHQKRNTNVQYKYIKNVNERKLIDNKENSILLNSDKNKVVFMNKDKPILTSISTGIKINNREENNLNLVNVKDLSSNGVKLNKIEKENFVLDKEKYEDDNFMLNGLVTSFYLLGLNNNKKIRVIGKKDGNLIDDLKQSSYIPQVNPVISSNFGLNFEDKGKYKYNNISIDNESKFLWDNLSFSLIEVVLRFLGLYSNYDKLDKLRKYKFIEIKDKLINRYYSENIWYLIYSLKYIKNEFYNINRDVLLSEKKDDVFNEYDEKINSNYTIDIISENLLDKENEEVFKETWRGKYKVMWKRNIYKVKLRDVIENRKHKLKNKLGYSEDVFKPYYRFMIPLLIMKSYSNYIKNYKKSLNKFLDYKENIITNNIYVVFNFYMVKTLLELFHYSYRSLIRVKPKLYYLNKIRFYISQLKKLTFTTWFASLKRARRLKKTPKYFLHRYFKVINSIYEQILYNARSDTKQKVLIPFVLHFEDILYSIYGKWVIIRLWPLKKYILSSFILTKRILLLMHWRNYFVNNNLMFRKIMIKLSNRIRLLCLQKGYSFYLQNSLRWPNKLINSLKLENSLSNLSYTNLEHYVERDDKKDILNICNIYNKNFNFYDHIYKISKNFEIEYMNFILKRKLLVKYYTLIDKNKINLYRFQDLQMKNYVERITNIIKDYNKLYLSLKKNSDIIGIKFKLVGRTRFSRSNQRSLRKISLYGNFMTPHHSSLILSKPITPFIPVNRGYLKAHIDSNLIVSKSSSGSFSVKVWIVSSMSVDVHELLLHLVRIKDLYNLLKIKSIDYSPNIYGHIINLERNMFRLENKKINRKRIYTQNVRLNRLEKDRSIKNNSKTK